MSATLPKVKICGLTEVRDAELAVSLGAWAVGMVFHDASPRRCSYERALEITSSLRREAELCGVFVNASLQELTQLADELGLTLLQLHGDEGPAFCAELKRRTGARVIKAMQIRGPGDVRELERYHVDFHLADARAHAPARRELRGGTGDTFDWRLLAGRRSHTPLILSGGLGPENVAAAVARVRPYAVDSASGTERAPGHKDPDRLRAFFEAIESGAELGPPTEDSPAEDSAAESAPAESAPA